MDEYIEKRRDLINEVCSIVIRSKEKDHELFEIAAIHRELLLNPEVALTKDLRCELEKRACLRLDFAEMKSIKGQIECVKVEKKLVCPIGQKEIVVPYYGDCGHAMEKKEALKYLKGNSKFVCPHAGCNKIFTKNKRS
ncbi:DNA repair protein Mms21 [Ordospora colligata]|uniref:DNA repair protein Mms21 n=1 Tax=Ordospora colligata OC4 TaxID=1354746 RepID=A0A0B2UMQ0_9MICR|nr:DNA repair protein Mms21 [Ordospora colligata OC4]KHN70327.1 DNA repair protein Mms21 [Ordospora colligata OC4]TBU16871.1 DNA repair protein Mms21 [Ordospora colligata]TBU16979.1 DNA repair protein Mms21 [Ordospora colligata]TBU19420.1 DNA repair protein Mms21 [Ordospora colligata]